jgi:alcohol dehydrogenase
MRKELGDLAWGEGVRHVLVVCDEGIVQAGSLGKVEEALTRRGIAVSHFSRVEANPRNSTIEAGAEALWAAGADGVVGLGGGSSLDAAKGVALLATNGGKMKDYDGRDKVRQPLLPLFAVPTTAGTGSEVSGNIAFTDAVTRIKLAARSGHIFPKVAILDPELLATLPARVAAATSLDALSHAVESFLSKNANALTEMYARESLRLVTSHLRAFVAKPSDLEHAGAQLLGSALGGMAMSNTGTGNVHAIARALGGMYDLHHGLLCGLLMPPVMAFNAVASPAKMEVIGRALGAPVDGKLPEEVGELVAEALRAMLRDLASVYEIVDPATE